MEVAGNNNGRARQGETSGRATRGLGVLKAGGDFGRASRGQRLEVREVWGRGESGGGDGEADGGALRGLGERRERGTAMARLVVEVREIWG